MSVPATTHVLPARAVIDTRTLHHLRNVGHDARRGDATAAECEFLLASIGPLLDELIARRNIDTGQVPVEAAVAYLAGVR